MAVPNWVCEDDWLAAENPHHLLHILRERGEKSRRKLRLAAVGCIRGAWDRMDDRCRQVTELVEGYADGRVPFAEMTAAAKALSHLNSYEALAVRSLAHRETWLAAHGVPSCLLTITTGGRRLRWESWYDRPRKAWEAFSRGMADAVRDGFGNPFRRVSFEGGWRTSTAVTLARTMYEDRNFGAMPILADALEDAGCDRADVLAHCRDGGSHFRGCWVVDLVLGLK